MLSGDGPTCECVSTGPNVQLSKNGSVCSYDSTFDQPNFGVPGRRVPGLTPPSAAAASNSTSVTASIHAAPDCHFTPGNGMTSNEASMPCECAAPTLAIKPKVAGVLASGT